MFFSRHWTNVRHRKTHERSGTTQSPPTRNTPCDSTRNTPVSGEEDLDPQRSDVNQHSDQFRYSNNSDADHETQNGYVYPPQQSLPHNHFRSFSHDGHLNHYALGPTSHGVNHLNGLHRATPPNEVEEDPQRLADNSPSDSDGSHSYHDEAPPSYAHQSNYSGMSVGTATLGVPTNGEIMTTPKDEISMQGDSLQKDYMPHPQMMDPSMMNQGWSYQWQFWVHWLFFVRAWCVGRIGVGVGIWDKRETSVDSWKNHILFWFFGCMFCMNFVGCIGYLWMEKLWWHSFGQKCFAGVYDEDNCYAWILFWSLATGMGV